MGFDLYPESTQVAVGNMDFSTPWPTAVGGTELDLRTEFHRFLFGSATEIPKGRIGILRRMRRDDDGNVVQCPCVSAITGEPDKDTPCNYCWTEGNLWDEEWITYYKMLASSHEGLVRKNQPHEPGVSNIPFVFFYLEYDVAPTRQDKIIEVARDVDGDIIVPYKRETIYPISICEDFRSDNGRVEYWRVAVTTDSVISNWQ